VLHELSKGINNLTEIGTDRNIVIGGLGSGRLNTIQSNAKGNDILISGTTSYDSGTQANILALDAILAELSSGADLITRVNAIETGLPGGYALNSTTVTWNGKNNVLNEGTQPNQQNWFIVSVPGDKATTSGTDKITFLP
jgi:hypothetical protein